MGGKPTPEMLDAGVEAYCEITAFEGFSAAEIVSAVFRAMIAKFPVSDVVEDLPSPPLKRVDFV